MKYKLKKDLPDAKAGAIFQWGLPGETNKNMDCLYNTSGWCALADFSRDKITNFDDWFEEVKPREWWEIEWQGEVYNKNSPRFTSFEFANDYIEYLRTGTDCILPNKIIKVREVND